LDDSTKSLDQVTTALQTAILKINQLDLQLTVQAPLVEVAIATRDRFFEGVGSLFIDDRSITLRGKPNRAASRVGNAAAHDGI
jgi:hypothetical protein